jgi:hypothetical protein
MNLKQLWSCRLDCRGPNKTLTLILAYISFDIYVTVKCDIFNIYVIYDI